MNFKLFFFVFFIGILFYTKCCYCQSI
ncbi:hypothetical protein FHS57_006451, partial [Runella defluvii]|nr:hypothetical protein [Runella defluvii]